MTANWFWIVTSPRGWIVRCLGGIAFFAVLLAIDLRRHGRGSPRLREYTFLCLAVLIGVVYGALNDLMTANISWEYFYYGKGLENSLGPATDLNAWKLRREAVKIGMLAAGSGALVGGAILLMVNSIRLSNAAALPMRRLIKSLAVVWIITVAGAIVFGAIGAAGGLAWTSTDLTGIVRSNLFRPRRFLCVYGIHLGAYVGAIVGTAAAARGIIRQRRRNSLRRASKDDSFTLPA